MTLLTWRDEFSVGVPAVDEEHRELIELINSLHAGTRSGHGRTDVLAALGEIFAQISAHFALEENIMRAAAYDGYAEHKAAHETLLEEIRDIMDRAEDDGSYDEQRLATELDRWFGEHFRTLDARLHGRLG